MITTRRAAIKSALGALTTLALPWTWTGSKAPEKGLKRLGSDRERTAEELFPATATTGWVDLIETGEAHMVSLQSFTFRDGELIDQGTMTWDGRSWTTIKTL